MRRLACIAVLLIVLASGAARADDAFHGLWFAPSSPWNTPIGTAEVTSYSATAVDAFAEFGHLNMNEHNIFTPAVIYGDSSKDKTQDIAFKDALGHIWTLPHVPVPQGLIDFARYRVKVNDTDGMVCLYDAARQGFYSFWQPTMDGTKIAITVGGFSPIGGPGWSALATHSPVQALDTPSLGRAVGSSYCGGVVRAVEIEAGHIDHALAIMWPNRLVRGWKAKDPIVFPATSTDGIATDTLRAVPDGARLQLDPSLTDTQLIAMGLNPVDVIVAHALQKFGGYIVDSNGAATAAICFENKMTSPSRDSFGATSPWPSVIYQHFRFVEPPAKIPLDTATSVGTPVP